MGNETKIIISAITAQAEASMRTLGNSVDSVSKKMFDFSGVAGTLAGALSITAFAGFIKSSIDAADELNNLSIKTGTSVEQLAGLKFAAEQSDTSLQAVAGAAKKLSSNIAENPQMFKKFGVDAKDSTGALIQLADIFQSMPDGVEKTALSVKLMGKSGEEMIPFLNQGGAAIAALTEEGRAYNPVTAESARMAADFNDNLDKLKSSAGAAGVAMTNNLLPQLTDISTAMALAAREGGLLRAVWVGLGGLGTAIFTDDMLSRTAQIDKRISSINTEIKSAEGQRGIATPISIPLRIERGNLETELDTIRKSAEAAAKKSAIIKPEQPTDSGKGKSLLDALGDSGKSSKPKADPNAASVISMQNDEFRKQMELLGVTSEQVKVYELAMNGATNAQIEQAQASANSIGVIKEKLDAEKQAKKQAEDAAKGGAITGGLKKDFELEIAKKNRTLNDVMMSAADKQHADNLDAVAQRAARAGEEIAKLNISEEERARLVAVVTQAEVEQKQKMEELRVQVEKDNASWEYGAKVAMRNYLDEITNVAKQSENLFSKAFKGMEDALVKFVRTGKLDFTSLADNIINDLIRIQIQSSITQPLSNAMNSGGGIVDMIGSLFGGSSASTGASVTGSSWTSSMPNQLFNANGNAFATDGVQAFANGGAFTNEIFDSPTLFKFANGGGFGNGVMGEAGPEAVMPLTRGANGKLGVQAFANGGVFTNKIFDSPTPFKFANGGGFGNGVMGEAGFEAVMPLTRGANGKLGVQASGGGAAAQVVLQVNVVNNASQQVSATAQQNSSGGFDLIIEQIEGSIARNVSRGTGALNGAMTQTFGLNRAAGAF